MIRDVWEPRAGYLTLSLDVQSGKASSLGPWGPWGRRRRRLQEKVAWDGKDYMRRELLSPRQQLYHCFILLEFSVTYDTEERM